MSRRGGVPACSGVGARVTRRNYRDLPNAAEWKCPECGRTVPVNYNGTLRWHTPKPKRP